MRVVLFDIDGTLQSSPGVGRLAFQRTLSKRFGTGESANGLVLSGRVDWAIWRELLGAHGHTNEEVDAKRDEYFAAYTAELEAILASPGDPKPALLPGVSALLAELARCDGVMVGLVTGNIQPAAWLKLEHTGIASHFSFGAFGDDAWERNALPPLALERASVLAGNRALSGADAVVIGDTVHDILCARAAGARVIAVSTGTDSQGTLSAAGADHVLPTLEQTEHITDLILG